MSYYSFYFEKIKVIGGLVVFCFMILYGIVLYNFLNDLSFLKFFFEFFLIYENFRRDFGL